MVGLLFTLIILLFNFELQQREEDNTGPTITYDYEHRAVILEGRFVITSFRSRSLNRDLFEYLYLHPGREISVDELDVKILKGRDVNLAKVSDAMGFRSEIKRLLFTCRADSITYHPEKLTKYEGVLKII
ncbi:hypothetical protein ACVSUK_16495 [Yersinia enterocolitica]